MTNGGTISDPPIQSWYSASSNITNGGTVPVSPVLMVDHMIKNKKSVMIWLFCRGKVYCELQEK
jgi:hypothetical protein